jgi:hypothetical protein
MERNKKGNVRTFHGELYYVQLSKTSFPFPSLSFLPVIRTEDKPEEGRRTEVVESIGQPCSSCLSTAGVP